MGSSQYMYTGNKLQYYCISDAYISPVPENIISNTKNMVLISCIFHHLHHLHQSVGIYISMI